MKLVGCAIVLKLEPQPDLSMPAKIILRTAIKEIPDSVNFRLEFLWIGALLPFDFVKDIEDGIKNNDLKNNIDAWILQAECAMQQGKK